MDTPHFDAVIVGSGFGGSVLAYRLAEAGLQVCLFERGRAYPPNAFPRSPYAMSRNFWDPSAGLYGLYHVWSFKHVEAVVASGLGGGSLIYANVLIRKDEKWFVREDLGQGGYEFWPVTRADLDPHYDRVEGMLGAQRYPFDHEPYRHTPKTQAFKEAAAAMGLEWQLPLQAVSFGNPGQAPLPGQPLEEEWPNLHGRSRQTCRLCGECVIGCNFGSKNTLDFNYLSAAQRHGAELWTQCEVRRFEPRPGGGYAVQYVRHRSEESAGQPAATGQLSPHTVTADRLILAAGALGSTYLLLKNQDAFPALSPMLGARFSGNGDIPGFVLRSRRGLHPGFGPTITSALRVPDRLDGGAARGHYVEDAGYPESVNWLVEALDTPGAAHRLLRLIWRRVHERLRGRRQSDLSAEIAGLLGGGAFTASSMPLLGMGRDVPDGRLELGPNGYLQTDWTVERSRPFFNDIRATMQRLARTLGADFVFNPAFRFNRIVTVHPLGGCPMGVDQQRGVVDSYGRVFNYPGLFVADGSIMPGPVGTNPALTIAALADRVADGIVTGAA